MSGTTEGLRRKIASAGDLDAVVRSMKALAASSIGQYERAIQSLEDYQRTLELGLGACLRSLRPVPQGPAKGPVPGDIGIVVFGSEQGLVGRFNEVLIEFALRTLGTLPGKAKKLWAVGERAQTLLADSGLPPTRTLAAPISVNAITPLIGQILIEIETAREKESLAGVHLFYNRPESASLYAPASRQLLPLDLAWQRRLAALPWPAKNLPEVVGETPATLQAFIRESLFVLLFQACAASLASENAARLAAMQRAEKNIEGILEDLNRTFHRLRQESIDEELFDVISGYEAMSKEASTGLSPKVRVG